MVESRAARRRQQMLPALAHWCLWTAAWVFWRHAFQGSDEPYHEGTGLLLTGICCGWWRLFYYHSSSTNGSIFCSSEECAQHPLQSSIVKTARQHSEPRVACSVPMDGLVCLRIKAAQSVHVVNVICRWENCPSVERRYSGDAVTRETYPGRYYLHAASSVLLSLSDSLSPWYLALPALLTPSECFLKVFRSRSCLGF